MSTVMPQSELVRQAIRFVDEHLSKGDKPLDALLEEAGMRFNLSPIDAEFLKKFFKQKGPA